VRVFDILDELKIINHKLIQLDKVMVFFFVITGLEDAYLTPDNDKERVTEFTHLTKLGVTLMDLHFKGVVDLEEFILTLLFKELLEECVILHEILM